MIAAFDPSCPRADALRRLSRRLQEAGIDGAQSDARFLLLRLLDLSATDLAIHGGAPIGADGARALNAALDRRLSGEPVARILGAWEFWGLPFALSPETLVPRPDTETLVEAALALVSDRSRPVTILDLGTGTGCILVALLSELPAARGVGIDRSVAALGTARINAQANGVGARAGFVAGNWSAPLAGPFDLIVSNPPYIASDVVRSLAQEVREHDPVAALDGGDDGLCAYRAILGGIAARPGLLAEDGAILLEIGYDQADAITALAQRMGAARCTVGRDLAGRDRVVTLRPPFDVTSPTTKVGR